MKESEIIDALNYKFKERLPDQFYKIVPEDRWKTPLITRKFDIVIYRKNYPLVVIEVKKYLNDKNKWAIGSDQVRSAISITNSRYGVVTDSEKFYFYDHNKKEEDFVEVSFDHIIEEINEPELINDGFNKKTVVRDIILSAAEKYLKDKPHFSQFLIKNLKLENINYSKDSRFYNFKDDQELKLSFENKFFIELLRSDLDATQICRYSTFKTVYEMINNKSFRMSGIVGMNDKSEVDFVEDYLYGMGEAGIERPLEKESEEFIKEINSRYISSCTEISNKDNLTLYRLYAEDGQGVCLIFDINSKNLNEQILLQKVKYGNKDKGIPELDFLKEILHRVYVQTDYQFEFQKMNYWKHFFKHSDYEVEQEVRLIVIDNGLLPKIKTDWVLTYTHSILNPVIDFKLNSSKFPIRLKEIILGPKCKEQEVNQLQLQEMIRRKKEEITEQSFDSDFKNLEVHISKIHHYR